MGLLQELKLRARANAGAPPATGAASPAGSPAAPAPDGQRFSRAAQAWLTAQRQAGERVAALKQAVMAQCAGEPAALLQQIEAGLAKLDQVLNTLDQRLTDALEAAGNAPDERSRADALKTAKAVVTEYIGYLKTEPLVAHMDRNPFNVKTDLKALLAGGLASAAKAIG